MSTATTDRGLHAVPAPPGQERFVLLLHLKSLARRAFDTLLALPRAAAGWVLLQAQRAAAALGANPALARIAARLRGLGDLIRTVGPIPATAAVLSVPAVWRATVRAARFLTSTLVSGASALWQRTRSLLMRLGPTGARIASGMATAGTTVRGLLATAAAYPVTRTIVRGIAALATLVRPVSQTTVIHRLLGRLVGATWLRWAIELLVLPLVIAPGLVADLSAGPRHTPPGGSAAGPARPTPSTEGAPTFAPTQTAGADQSTVEPDVDGWASPFEPRNRAERRAQQQAQTHAKRARARH